jgi:hypothetical protein
MVAMKHTSLEITGYYANLETAATEAADGARHHVDSAPALIRGVD